MNELYQQGLQDLHRAVANRLDGRTTAELLLAADVASLPCEAAQDRKKVILLLALAE
ncbi:hypothetical protein [Streptomyces sp. NPDC057280]|uniref:hypothetical protein n=1 Tax=Streptomyces sp. NPDC057280 TaxID=3346081 RepID=UPI0036314FFE